MNEKQARKARQEAQATIDAIMQQLDAMDAKVHAGEPVDNDEYYALVDKMDDIKYEMKFMVAKRKGCENLAALVSANID